MLEQELEQARQALKETPEPVSRPVLVVVSGLPGSGKSYFSRKLAERLPSAVVESDVLRQALFSAPTHSQAESRRVFQVCHLLISDLLKRGVRVILDATNLEEGRREQLYHIAESLRAKLILVQVKAPEEVVKERLERRSGAPEAEEHSDAGWEIYQRMRPRAEPMGRSHFVVDTSRDISPVIEKVWREAQR